ncbi:MAG: PIN domain-containing protein [Acidobacteriota bacterium]|nr:PIN domain-containing protein [Acidobacteriota bacterium]
MTNFILADEYVTDTVGLILYLEKRKSGGRAEQIFDAAENANTIIHIPAMVFAEILYFSEKKRISATLTDVFQLLQNFPNFKEFTVTQDVIESAAQTTDVPELHDRIISAAAKLLNLELITNDKKIQSSIFLKTI